MPRTRARAGPIKAVSAVVAYLSRLGASCVGIHEILITVILSSHLPVKFHACCLVKKNGQKTNKK